MPDIEEPELAGEPPGVLPVEEVAWEPFGVVKQEVTIEINFREKSIQGMSTIFVFPLRDDLDEIKIDARQCNIDTENITVNDEKVEAHYDDPYKLLVPNPRWLLTVNQHGVLKKHLHNLIPGRLAECSVAERQYKGCVPVQGALRVKLRPNDQTDGPPKRPILLKTRESNNGVDGTNAKEPDSPDRPKMKKISIPFRTTGIRDGVHFVGVDESDTRYPHIYTRHSVEPGTASCIFPCIDDPGSRVPWTISIKCPRTLGDVLGQPLATQQFSGGLNGESRKRRNTGEVRRPEDDLTEEDKLLEMTAICSGVLTGETVDDKDERNKVMHFETSTSVGAQHIGFAVGPFEHVELWSEFRTEEMDDKLGANATKIHGYCLPGRADEVRNTCSPIVWAADYFGLHFGKYPFDSYKICFVEDMVPDTAAACSLSLCSTRLLYPEDIIDEEIETTRILVHSLASQFVGVHIVPNKRSDTWLVIGMQWFMADIFMKELCGNNTYRFMQKTLADKLVETDVDRPSLHDLGAHLHIGDFELEFMALKAPLLLFILDQRMRKIPGNTGVLRVISRMISTANINDNDDSMTSASAEAFFKMCEKQSQVRCDNFRKQWVQGAGCPRLFVKQKFNKKNTTVEIGIYQTQADRFKPGIDGSLPKRRLRKEEFWREFRELQEEEQGLFAKDVQAHFIGPLSIQIHEADGRPYEHLVEIMENHINGSEFKITYYTKYKRLKKKRRQKEGGPGVAKADGKDDIQEDVAYYSCFGDVLQSDADVTGWGLGDWTEEEQIRMSNESYEWIGIDTDFEWICEKISDMPFYMYLAQLQQDRDVVAQQDSLLAIGRGWVHPMASTILARTLMDRRYYHGIRTMAAQDLPRQALREMNMLGLAHLILSYRYMFCYRVGAQPNGEVENIHNREVGENTQSSYTASGSLGGGNSNGAAQQPQSGVDVWSPQPNDFSDKSQYHVQLAIVGAIGRVRDESRRCPKAARDFLLELLVLNDNSTNVYSDQFYIAKLLEALTSSIITEVDQHAKELVLTLNGEDDADRDFKQFIERVIGEIDRYRRMDEWTSSYHNIWTTTALECKQRLMKARIIPTSAVEFVQYVQDGNLDLVRIKAFESLVELGLMLKPPILRLLLATISGDSSPFVRDRLFKSFCQGIAAIAMGEMKTSDQPATPVGADLIVEAGDVVTDKRRAEEARKVDLGTALKALKAELKDDRAMALSMWKAVQSSTIGLAEMRDLLALCSSMYDAEDSLCLKLLYPREWRVDRSPPMPGRLMMRFSSTARTQPRVKLPLPQAPEVATTEPMRAPEPKRIRLQSRPSITGPSDGATAPPPLERQPSISVIPPRPVADSIEVRPLRPRTPISPTPPLSTPPPAAKTVTDEKPVETRPKSATKKRKSDDGETSDRPRKVPRSETGPKKHIVTLKLNYSKLSEDLRRSLESSTSPRATPGADASSTAPMPAARPITFHPSAAAASPPGEAPPTVQEPVSVSQTTPGGAKPRKPLPSSAPHPPAQPTGHPASVAPVEAAPVRRIKLVTKKSEPPPPPPPPPA